MRKRNIQKEICDETPDASKKVRKHKTEKYMASIIPELQEEEY